MRHHNFHPPPRTIMEVYRMLPEGTLAELIDGILYMSPAPTTKHQKTLRNLSFAIHEYVRDNKLGETLFSACDVFWMNILMPFNPTLSLFSVKIFQL
ncbi:Uma2 family endonuclease [Chryseosolibacter indicus]|uniref:Uma2 family endonuclease n=1 Tax=Chryseosolibacter indicus TaxID=2782351 RepID=A0ABS5VVF9_9BACT|nr:Uma2 family endonuclease [Chryseosolibacter indicus]MBT1704795.1 Uma2 family endonuclease [Chryseosolibacter indicus]